MRAFTVDQMRTIVGLRMAERGPGFTSRAPSPAVREDHRREEWHTMADLTSQAKGAVEAFNNADWDNMRKSVEDSTYNEFGTQRSLSGIDAILEAMKGWKAAMPDVRGTVTGAVEGGQRVVLEVCAKDPRPVRWSQSRAPSQLLGSGRRRLPRLSSTTRTGS